MAHFFAPHVIFLWMNVTHLLYLLVTNIAKLYPLAKVGSASMKLIVIV